MRDQGKSWGNFSQDIRSPGRDLGPGPYEQEAGELCTRARRSVLAFRTSRLSQGWENTVTRKQDSSRLNCHLQLCKQKFDYANVETE